MRRMSDSDNYTNSVFPLRRTEKSTFQHLRPLSIYSHMVYREQYNPSSPLCNIQVQITNITSNRYKRRLDDSCLDETCKTPLKKACLYKSCSPDQGCIVDSLDFSPGVQGSTPTLIISKDVTPPRSKVIQPVTPVMSTPVSQCMHNRSVQAREGLPSPIPVLNWDRDVPSCKISLSVDLCNSVNVSLTGCQEDGKSEVREVSHVRIPVHESKSRETAATEAVVEVKEESQLTESKLDVTARTEESFENSLPLQVQVKSKVVIPETTKTVCQLERKPECDIYRRARYPVQRPVVFCNGENWQRAKRAYMESVMRHMETHGSDGVMTELHHLMNTVAGQRHSQRSGRDGGQWQHPSDLTQRNYRVRGPLLSLSEWQKRNHLDLRRFAEVPDIFHRSPVL